MSEIDDRIEAELRRARELLENADAHFGTPLYVAETDEPVRALSKIREYLYQGLRATLLPSPGTVLAIACLDRVIVRLESFRLRLIYDAEAMRHE
jgi:hypothetical protein